MDEGEITRLGHRKSLLFVNKKKQKNFVNLELARTGQANARSDLCYQKFFASFFQKRCLLSVLPPGVARFRGLWGLGLGLTIGVASAAAQGVNPGWPMVRTAQGVLSGRPLPSGGGVFKGIPYAQPPVGPLRWRLPQPPMAWQGVRDAGSYGAACPQPPMRWSKDAGAGSEDCLFLNVWSPEISSGTGLPVMVFIHGGGFVDGSGAAPLYDGTALSTKGVVAITINYRLGVFGFLAAPQLSASSPLHVSGNYGLADQIAALRWVRANIARFGGDPAKVTVFGQSAGSTSISDLMTSPLAAGLFRGAIMQSGPAVTPGGRMQSLAEAQAKGAAFFAAQADSTLSALRAIGTEQIMQRWQSFSQGRGRGGLGPIVDGWLLPKLPTEVYRAHAEMPIPILIGTNSRDNLIPGDDVHLVAALQKAYGPLAPAALRIYGLTGKGFPPKDPVGGSASDVWGTDRGMRCPTIMQESLHAAQGSPVYAYQFEQSLQGLEAAGAAHTYELPYVFGYMKWTPRIPATYGPRDQALSEIIQTYWTNFAKTGNPNDAQLPVWPRFEPRGRAYVRFSYAGAQVASNLRGQACALYQRRFFP